MFVLLDTEYEICAFVDLSNTSPFLFKSVNSTPLQLSIHIAKFPYDPLYRRLVPYISHFQRPPLHPSLAPIGLTIVDALKLTKSKKYQN